MTALTHRSPTWWPGEREESHADAICMWVLQLQLRGGHSRADKQTDLVLCVSSVARCAMLTDVDRCCTVEYKHTNHHAAYATQRPEGYAGFRLQLYSCTYTYTGCS